MQVPPVEQAGSDGEGSFVENLGPPETKLAGAEAGATCHTGKSLQPGLLRDWPDDDGEMLTDTGGAASPRGGDGSVKPLR